MVETDKILSAFRAIRTEADYDAALALADELMDAEPESPEATALEALAILIEKYEDVHYPMETPTLLEALEFRMEQQGLTQSDLAKLLNSRSRASEIRNGKRKPTLAQAAMLYQQWHIPPASLFEVVEDRKAFDISTEKGIIAL